MLKKQKQTLENLGNNIDKLLVQKSLPLYSLWKSKLTLAEFKILDTYLSRIDSRNPDKRTIIFEKGELEKILKVQKINNADLKARLRNLMENAVEITDKEEKKGFKLVTLFEEAEAEQDEKGVWKVKLECTQKAMKYFFNIENLGYLRYKLRCITSISSRYAYIMFVYLETNRFRKSWDIDLTELKILLNCDKEETYKQYKRFNDLVLKKIQKELQDKTECKYTYETIKKGRAVSKIKFTLETLKDFEGQEKPTDDKNQITIDDYLKTIETPLWHSALTLYKGEDFTEPYCEFTDIELKEISEMLAVVPLCYFNKYAQLKGDMSMGMYHYIAQKYAMLNNQASKIKINNRFKYFLKMIEKDTIVE